MGGGAGNGHGCFHGYELGGWEALQAPLHLPLPSHNALQVPRAGTEPAVHNAQGHRVSLEEGPSWPPTWHSQSSCLGVAMGKDSQHFLAIFCGQLGLHWAAYGWTSLQRGRCK